MGIYPSIHLYLSISIIYVSMYILGFYDGPLDTSTTDL